MSGAAVPRGRPVRHGARALLLGALAALLVAACGRSAPERHSVLLVTLDTTRADALSCLGGRPGLTPNLDALAAAGVLYTEARTVAPLTMPAHSSILTGLYPPRHGVRDNNVHRLPASATTVAERAHAAGYQTAAFVSSIAVDRAFGFGQGFDLYDQPPRALHQVQGHENARDAATVVKRAIAWLQGERDRARPFFVWVHIWDPHAPYTPFAPFLAPAGGDPYLAEVHGADFALGKLFEELRAEKLWDDLAVVVVGDHGEGRGDLGEPTHGTFLWDATVRVPLIVRDPSGARAGERCNEPASVADVAPTVLEAMGLTPAADLDGRSLWRRHLDPARGVYYESYTGWTYYGWSPLVGWSDREGELLVSSDSRRVPPDATGEARAGRPLTADDEAFAEPRRRAIAAVLAEPALPADDTSADPALLADLRNLGYAASGVTGPDLPDPFGKEALARPSPMDRVAEHEATLRAIDLVSAGRTDEGLEALRAVIAQNPDNVKALGRMSDVLVAAGRYDEARPLLEHLLAIGPPSPGVHFQLGVVLQAAGEDEAAAAHWRAALAIDPGHVQSMQALSEWERAHPAEATTSAGDAR